MRSTIAVISLAVLAVSGSMVAAIVLLRNQSQMPSEQRFGNRQVAIGVSIFLFVSIALALLLQLLGGCLRISRNGGSNMSDRCYAEGLNVGITMLKNGTPTISFLKDPDDFDSLVCADVFTRYREQLRRSRELLVFL